MFKEIDNKKKLSELERDVLNFWQENKIFEQSLAIRKDAKTYSFYDGPPFATGTPHHGHIVGNIMKDVVPRFWTMKGLLVERKWGWDCHGLPIENIAEKALGITHKKQIEEMGVEKFNETCRSKVLEYVKEWEIVIKKLGRWVDMENAYRTMDISFMESVWQVFKQLWDNGLIYESYRSMHICPRCETTLSQSEVAEGYKDIKDLSVIAKFELVDPVKSLRNSNHGAGEPGTFVLAWTTTPWTLPGNAALAVGEDIDYVKAGVDGKYYILAKDRAGHIFKDYEIEVIDEFKGRDLIGKKYKPLFDYYSSQENLENKENGWKIYGADFVTTEDGTGVVHIAPAFGEDDLKLGQKYKLPFIQHVGMDGIIKEEAKDFAGFSVKPKDDHQKTDIEIIKYLAEKKLLFSKEKYEHSYPHCWRCDTPLLNYATSSWFVNVEKIKNESLELAKDINWVPKYIKNGRFGNWLSGARDWSISRQRYWASVMPIWKCEKCDEIKVIGSVKELEDLSGEKVDDLHKHIVDKITFKCDKCDGIMRRVPDVLDTWFDSGSMPYAQAHYPFENKDKFDSGFPADFIAEGIDQTRCWFYYLHIISTAIKKSIAYKNVVANGIVLAEDGKKMSKRLKNYPDPLEVIEKYGADALRFYLLSSPVVAAENLNFKESDVADIVRGMMRMLRSSYSFFALYANVDEWQVKSQKSKVKSQNLLDKWIISELNILIKEVNEAMEAYELNKAVRFFPKFIDNLSNWYIRRSRRRFWKSEDDADKNNAYQTLYTVLVELSKTMAPFTPFISETIYRNLVETQDFAFPHGNIISVHLQDFPVADKSLIDEKLNNQMEKTRKIVEMGLAARAKAKIKVRQPLGQLLVNGIKELPEELIDLIKDEVNVKELRITNYELSVSCHPEERSDEESRLLSGGVENRISLEDSEIKIALDTTITEELQIEGMAREIVRLIQQARKNAGLDVSDRIEVAWSSDDGVIQSAFEDFRDYIMREVLAEKMSNNIEGDFDFEKELETDGKRWKLGLTKIKISV